MTDTKLLVAKHKGHIKDARGRGVTQIDPITMHSLHRPGGMDPAALEVLLNDLERGLARQLMWRSYVLRILLGLAIAATAFLVFWLIGDANFRAALEKVLTSEFAAYLPLVIGAFLGPLLMARRRHSRRVLHLLLKHRLCPHCGYNLRELPVDPDDGATVCPECGCAWRLDDPHITEPAAARPIRPRSHRVWWMMAAVTVGVGALVLLVAMYFIARI